jgi:hypothetical protein
MSNFYFSEISQALKQKNVQWNELQRERERAEELQLQAAGTEVIRKQE